MSGLNCEYSLRIMHGMLGCGNEKECNNKKKVYLRKKYLVIYNSNN